jgi:hypothetical protein
MSIKDRCPKTKEKHNSHYTWHPEWGDWSNDYYDKSTLPDDNNIS